MKSPQVQIVAGPKVVAEVMPVLAELVAHGEVLLRIARVGRRTLGALSLYPVITPRIERLLGWVPRHPARPGMRLRERGSALLANLEVDADSRRRGIGSALVADACALAKTYDRRALSLYVEVGNDDAVAFYRALGFRRVRQLSPLTPGGAPCTELTRRL